MAFLPLLSALMVLSTLCAAGQLSDPQENSGTELGSVVSELMVKHLELAEKHQLTQVRLDLLQKQVEALEERLQAVEKKLQYTGRRLRITARRLQLNDAKLHVTMGELQTTRKELQLTNVALNATRRELQEGGTMDESGGSTYIRWGRKTCPGNVSTLVYSGLAGGKLYSQKGSGSNRLCLTKTPEYDRGQPKPTTYSYLYGAEYEHIGGLHDREVPCAVCRTTRATSTSLMVPGTRTCPEGWTRQYLGNLASDHHTHYASDYLCLDQEAGETEFSETSNKNGALFYWVLGQCGSLPCPPYEQNGVITCVVCSK
ncbi:short-chain collagen C4-like [Babylonia areolata]|uniref:short-chain collagen C4-like n=1 Tax=Babylonia areolata TaxID=304850 RepID=UPI003FD65801